MANMAVAATVTANVLFMIAFRSIALRLLTTRSSQPAAGPPRAKILQRERTVGKGFHQCAD
jgi:hypothetical protein